jgi:pimeloyl-ACP methyl ester carboxylesterase
MVRGELHRGVSREQVEAFAEVLRGGWARENPAFRQVMTTQFWPEASARQMGSFNHMQGVSCDAETAAEIVHTVAEMTVEPDLAAVRAPTLVLHSADDAIVPLAEGQLSASRIPGAKLMLFDSPNHTPLEHEEAFAVVQHAIFDFVHAHDPEASRLHLVTRHA